MEILKTAFSFDIIIYVPIAGVSMQSPFALIMALLYPHIFLYHWIGIGTTVLSPKFLEQCL